jgi:signal transduction histidine kinase
MAEAAADRFKNRSLANLLHGQVQNSLLSASLRLESGSVSKHELQVEIDSLIKLLDTPIRIGANQLSQGVPFSQGMQEITHRWRGFAAISFNNFSIISEVPDLNTNLLLELLEEAVANAVRHGLADSVVVELDSTPKNRLSISVIDNGVGPRAGKFGLGSALFEIVSGGNWSLTAQPEGGSKLEIQFDSQAEFNPR